MRKVNIITNFCGNALDAGTVSSRATHALLKHPVVAVDCESIDIAQLMVEKYGTMYRCSTCKPYVRRVGRLAYFDPSVSRWVSVLFGDPEDQENKTREMAKLIVDRAYRSKTISEDFNFLNLRRDKTLTGVNTYGTAQMTGGFNHFHVTVPYNFTYNGNSVRYFMQGLKRCLQQTGGLDSMAEVARHVMKYLTHNNDSDSKALQTGLRILTALSKVNNTMRLSNVAGHVAQEVFTIGSVSPMHSFWNSAFGKFFISTCISEASIDKHYGTFLRETDITNYRIRERRNASIQTTEALKAKLGNSNAMGNFNLRFATMDDLEPIWLPKVDDAQPNEDATWNAFEQALTDMAKVKPATEIPTLPGVKRITFATFRDALLPRAEELKLTIGDYQHWIDLLYPVNTTITPIFKHQNPEVKYTWMLPSVDPTSRTPCTAHGIKDTSKLSGITKTALDESSLVLLFECTGKRKAACPDVSALLTGDFYQYRADFTNMISYLPQITTDDATDTYAALTVNDTVTFAVTALVDGSYRKYTVVPAVSDEI